MRIVLSTAGDMLQTGREYKVVNRAGDLYVVEAGNRSLVGVFSHRIKLVKLDPEDLDDMSSDASSPTRREDTADESPQAKRRKHQ